MTAAPAIDAALWFAGLLAHTLPFMTEPAAASPAPAFRPTARRGRPSVDDYVAGVRSGDRAMLARAITLVESTAPAHEATAQEVLQRLLPATGHARRVGITGVPGVGKSTFIETLGTLLCGRGLKVAVLAIDPSSALSRGSILGDRTRMERLTAEPNAFIRPSPSGGNLGGVARRTRETLLLCEAAGFDVVMVETVGVGQSETTLRSMVDFFLLLLLPGAGDDLQGIKRGIMEMADAVLINKADGDNRQRAEAARGDQALALHHLAAATPGWQTPVSLCSGLTGEGLLDAWLVVERFYQAMGSSGVIAARRRAQTLRWMEDLAREEILSRFEASPETARLRATLERGLGEGTCTAVHAARSLVDAFLPRPVAGTPPSGSTPNPVPPPTPC